MGNSFVKFNNQGFWSSDEKLELLLFLMAAEVDHHETKPDWLLKAREQWYIHATAGFLGAVNPALSEIIDSSDKRKEVLSIAIKAKERLIRFGKTIPIDFMNQTGVGGSYGGYEEPVPVSFYLETADKFIKLLESAG